VMEAMATGLPLVVTDCRGNRDLVQNGENGFVVGIDDAEGMAERMEALLVNKSLRVIFGDRSKDKINIYKIESILEEMSRIYKMVLGGI